MEQRVRNRFILVDKTEMENTLRAVWADHAGPEVVLSEREVEIYRAGFQAALQAVGMAVGVDWQPPAQDKRAATRIDGRL